MAHTRLVAPLRKLTIGCSRARRWSGRPQQVGEKICAILVSPLGDVGRHLVSWNHLGRLFPGYGTERATPSTSKHGFLVLQLRHISYAGDKHFSKEHGPKDFPEETTHGINESYEISRPVKIVEKDVLSNISIEERRNNSVCTQKEADEVQSDITVKKSLNTSLRSHVLAEILKILNNIEKTDDLSSKLAPFEGKVTFHEATTLMKVMNNKLLCFSFYVWLKQQSNFTPNFQSLVTVMRLLTLANKWEKLSFVSQDLFNAGYKLDNGTYCRIIKEASLCKKVTVCEDWFQKMKGQGCWPDLTTYNTMIHAYALARLPQKSFATFGEMKEMGIDPDINTFCHLLTACQKTGDHEAAHNVFLQMKNHGLTPDLITYSILLDTFGKQGKATEAGVLFKDMQDAGIQPDSKVYNSLIHAYATAGMMDKATTSFQEYQKLAETNPDKIVFWTMLQLYSRAGMLKDALAVKRMMRVAKIPVDGSCYLNLIDGFRRKERWEDAARAFKEMQRYKCPIEVATWEMMMKVYSKAGHHVQCERVFDHMMTKGYRDRLLVYEIMISIYKRTNHIKNANRIYELMKRNNCPPNRNICNTMIHLYAKAGMLPACERIAEEMGAAAVKPDKNTFLSLIKGYVSYGHYFSAMHVYDMMKETGVKPDYELSELIVQVLIKNEEVEKAEKFLKAIVADGINPNKRMVSAIMRAGGVVELSRPLAVNRTTKSGKQNPKNSLKSENS